MKRMNRRAFLAVAAAGGAALVIPRSLRALIDSPPARGLGGLLSGVPSASAIGRAYLNEHPNDRDVERLIDHVSMALPGGRDALDRLPVDELRRRLEQAVTADFTVDRIVRVDGWVLAITEARLCALAALTA